MPLAAGAAALVGAAAGVAAGSPTLVPNGLV
jgi:hypothetical protein